MAEDHNIQYQIRTAIITAIITAIVTFIPTYYLTRYQAEETRKNLEYQIDESRKNIIMQIDMADKTWKKQYEISSAQKKSDLQTKNATELIRLYYNLHDLRGKFYLNRYELLLIEARYKATPTKETEEVYNKFYNDVYLKEEQYVSTQYSQTRAEFVALLSSIKNTTQNDYIKDTINNVANDVTAGYSEINREQLMVLCVNRILAGQNLDWQEYYLQASSSYNLPNSFDILRQTLNF